LPQPFYIEDSAISFAYARNLAEGEGLVPYPGGERVEGYSNALWTFLIASFYTIGVPVWTSPKLMGAVFGSLTLFFAWGLARRARPDAQDPLAVLAPFFLACSTQFVLWNASGLENSLFNLLLAAGMWALVREIQDGHSVPWSAFAFVGLSMTRPDGIAYAAIGLSGRVLGTLARRQWSALPLWVLAFGVPYAAYNAWRYDYFAWWFPNTYYAKEKVFRPFGWTQGGWKQVKEYATQYGIVYAAPLVVIALTGLSTWRRWVGASLLVVYAIFLLWDGRTGIPTGWTGEWSRILSRNWTDARVWYLLGGSALLGLVTFGRKGWEARGLLWAAFCSGVFFCVWSGGDWMKGLRWFSMTSVPLFTLLGVGAGALAARLPFAGRRFAGWMPVAALWATPLAVAIAAPNVNGSWTFANNPETAPRDVHKRVKYMTWVQRRLGLEQVTLMDVDMGAHMWWSGWDIVDIAGLVDMPMAHHRKYNKKFVTEYVFEERKPDFAHVHGSWARQSKIHLNERWDEYVEIPGYPSGKRTLHVGNHVRKEHLVTKRAAGPEGRKVPFGGGVTLEGWDVPAPEVAAGGRLYVSTSWRAAPPAVGVPVVGVPAVAVPAVSAAPSLPLASSAMAEGERKEGFRVLAFLANENGVAHVAEVAPGYDWYDPTDWQPHELVRGDWSIALPESLREGTYDFGFVVLDEATGVVLPYSPVEPGAPPEAARFMVGEWRSAGLVHIVGGNDVLAAADADYDDALALAKAGDCDGAATAFQNARRHVSRNDRWFLTRVDSVTTARVSCLVARAQGETEAFAQARALAEARKLDHRNDELVAMATPLAQGLVTQGDTARANEDWEGAYRAYSAALSIDATLSWTRRAAEEMRDLRLGIDPEAADAVVPKAPAPKKPTPKKPVTKKPTPRKPSEKPSEEKPGQKPTDGNTAPAAEKPSRRKDVAGLPDAPAEPPPKAPRGD
ncbi:MAG: hypothetical protein Q8P18_16820, partial [Pseudomonadota bacterium]|nr:hypothetical protein [Pseudomonadota bacterium]